MRTAARGLRAVIVLAVLTGLLYPAAMTAIAKLTMPGKADGSLLRVDGAVVGSSEIGQPWTGDRWFHGRPSVVGYDASASSGSNLAPTSKELAAEIEDRIRAILKLEGPYHPGFTAADVPVDLVTASASGLDPDISVAAAEFQAPRIAAVRDLSLGEVLRLIHEHVEGKQLGFLGEPRVNVLELNLALERAAPS